MISRLGQVLDVVAEGSLGVRNPCFGCCILTLPGSRFRRPVAGRRRGAQATRGSIRVEAVSYLLHLSRLVEPRVAEDVGPPGIVHEGFGQ